MKRSIVIMLSMCALFLSSFADDLVFTGAWDDGIQRIAIPQAPKASVDGDIVSIHFVDALSDLTVKISDYDGNLIYEDVISGSNGESYTIPCFLESGEYILSVSHHFGFLSGSFEVD